MDTVAPIPELEIVHMDELLREIKRPVTFLRDLLFPPSTHRTLTTGSVMWDQINRGLQMAPFVAVNGQPVNLNRGTSSSKSISTPHIAVQLPLQASEELNKRMAGDTQVIVPVSQRAAQDRMRLNLLRQIVEDLEILLDSIDNREEWMVAMMLRGRVEYIATVDGEDSFEYETSKPAANTITLTTGINDATLADAEYALLKLIDDVADAAAANHGPPITDAFLGADAAAAFSELVNKGAFKNLIDRTLNKDTATRIKAFNEWDEIQGLVYKGLIKNVRFWFYNNDAGTGSPLIRSEFIEFVPVGGLRDRRLFYGALTDTDAVLKGVHVTKRFTKTLQEKGYNTSLKQIAACRPLPVFRRPEHYFSADVIV